MGLKTMRSRNVFFKKRKERRKERKGKERKERKPGVLA